MAMIIQYNLSSAISWKKKKAYTDGRTKRWLDHDSTIKFELKELTSSNAEFIINDNPDHLIWFSQISDPFLHLETFNLVSGSFVKKDGTQIALANMRLYDFISYVKGKTFRVVVNPDGEVAKFDKEKLPSNQEYNKIINTIKELVQTKNFIKAAEYLLPATAYDFYEI